MEFIEKRKQSLQETADSLFRITYNLIVSDETKLINFVVTTKKMKRNYIGRLVIHYALRNEQKDYVFEHWEYQVVKLVKPISTTDNSEYILQKMEDYLIQQMKQLFDLYFENMDSVSEEEKELLLNNHVITTNLFVKSLIEQSPYYLNNTTEEYTYPLSFNNELLN